MQEFFMDYGLWLLIGLLILIGVIFLLVGRKTSAAAPGAEQSSVAVKEAAPVLAPAAEPTPPPPTTIAAESAPVAAPEAAPVVATQPAAPASDGQDNLLRMKGVGPKLNQLLIELGVTRYEQIANWTEADLASIDTKLGNFKGRPVRDQWIDQAKYLAAGDFSGFEAKYGKL